MHTTAQRRPRLRSAIAAGGLALGLTLLAAGPASAAPVVDEVTLAATPEVEIGETVDVSSVLVGATDVYSYAVTFAFDPELLAYVEDSATTGPAGGFDTVELGDGTVTVLHSRLGTSPALTGDLPVALTFDTIGDGDATITESVTLVDTVGGTTVLADAATSTTAIAALPVVVVPPVDPPVDPPATAEPTPAAAVPSATPLNPDGSLALTGFDSGILIAVGALGLAAIAAGAVVVRRRTAANR